MNKFIVGNSSTGKTRQLLEHAKEQGAMVICKNPSAMQTKAQAYGIIGLNFASYDDLIRCNSIYDGETWIGQPFVIDEVADFLSEFFADPCVGFTQTED